MNLIPLWMKLAAAATIMAALAGLYAWRVHVERDVGRAEVRAEWNAQIAVQMAAAMKEGEANARETFRRLESQQENQRVQDQELAVARADAARNAADAERLREQNASTARQWRDALRDSPAGSVCQAAGAAIAVQADVLGRVDRAAAELTGYADAARVAGLKCERDYDTLNKRN